MKSRVGLARYAVAGEAGATHPRSVGVLLGTVLIASFGVAGCDTLLPGLPGDETILDGPIDGLSQPQVHLFVRGDEEFGRRFSPSEGLGPVFNAPSCDSCHPGEGRAHPEFGFTRFGRWMDGVFDPMRAEGGPQLQDRGVPGYPPEELPDGDIVQTILLAPAITGLGLLEAVDDATLIALADPEDADGDGISGRVHWVPASNEIQEMVARGIRGTGTRPQAHGGRYIGRFGRKASNVNLLHQTVQAYHQDMGLTSDFALEDPVNHEVGAGSGDVAGDPEIPSDVLLAVNFYLRTLRPPLRRDEGDSDVLAGEQLFAEAQCTSCHIPSMTTGESEIDALSVVTFHPYTDLLLHDMGPELDDGYVEGDAGGSEWRTSPLWGLGLAADFQGGRTFYLHDGRAETLHEAIELHGGEGASSREAYRRFSEREKEQLRLFLLSL